jgi:invasion protein IalB
LCKPKRNRAEKVAQAFVFCLAFGVPFIALAESRLEVELNRQLAQATQANPTPAPAQPVWGVTCAGGPGGLDCRAAEVLRMTDTGQLSVSVHLAPQTKKPEMLLLLPLGIHLPAGVTLHFGQDQGRVVPLQNCDSSGCLAEYAISDAEINGMVKGQPLTVSVQDANKQPLSVRVPTASFAAAYAKIK